MIHIYIYIFIYPRLTTKSQEFSETITNSRPNFPPDIFGWSSRTSWGFFINQAILLACNSDKNRPNWMLQKAFPSQKKTAVNSHSALLGGLFFLGGEIPTKQKKKTKSCARC